MIHSYVIHIFVVNFNFINLSSIPSLTFYLLYAVMWAKYCVCVCVCVWGGGGGNVGHVPTYALLCFEVYRPLPSSHCSEKHYASGPLAYACDFSRNITCIKPWLQDKNNSAEVCLITS
jgi:hypothetical protein